MRNARQHGFTLIELVVVIVILGILSAFAVPRFMGMEGRARIATLDGMQGSLKSVAAMAHGVWLADGTNATTLTMENQSIAFTNGYPTRASVNLLLQDMSGFTYTANNGRFAKVGAPGNCYVQYNNAAAGAAPVIIGHASTPTATVTQATINATFSGCGQ